ncbi:hypothetical protein DFR76_115127 [Nocardia pseudobrasiliensis]|uniref:Uncharacterized protein n=1 Tax=Nocardia pseudobrasiliensis TaxID=45979 RepID=A0A370HPV5_9NOCA|nr:hypothetical protein DFR76_115127 [Nocardia pseudobrasiliensis]
MCAAKGPHRALEFARAAGRTLVMVSKIREAEEHAFYEQHIMWT